MQREKFKLFLAFSLQLIEKQIFLWSLKLHEDEINLGNQWLNAGTVIFNCKDSNEKLDYCF